MTWDADRPKGNQPFNVGDEAIAANFAWLEAAIGVDQTFPGTTTTRGRKKGDTDTVTNADGLSGLEDGNEIHISDLGGGSQQDGDGASTHFWPHRYSAAGGSSQLSAWVPLTPPIADDATEQTALEGKLGTDDLGLVAYRLIGSLYVPLVWNGSAFVTVGELPTIATDFLAIGGGNGGSLGGTGTDFEDPTTGPWDLMTDGTDDFEVTLSVPDVDGATVKVRVEMYAPTIRSGLGDQNFIWALMRSVDAASETWVHNHPWRIADQNSDDNLRVNWSFLYEDEVTGPNGADESWVYRIRVREADTGTSPSARTMIVCPGSNLDGLGDVARYPARPNGFMRASVSLTAVP